MTSSLARFSLVRASLVAALGSLVALPSIAQSPAPPAAAPGGGAGGIRAGQPVFQQHCNACHTPEGLEIGGRLAPSLNTLQDLPPERILDALTTGKMQAQGAGLSEQQRRLVSEWLSNRPLGSALSGDVSAMQGRCKANPPLSDPSRGPAWSGWSPRPDNARFQDARAAGLTPAEVPSLKLKWAFGLPQGADTYSQPSVASGRVFFGSDNAFVYSVDARTGCAYWSFRTDGAVRSAPVIAPIAGRKGVPYAVFVGDGQNRIYALDARTGALLWKTRVDTQPRSHMTASLTYAGGRIFVPVAAGETLVGGDPQYECCKTRGAVIAVEAATGKVLWRTETIRQPAAPRGRNARGVQLWGPGGASVWNAPTADAKRGLVYVGTGNGYTAPAADTSDSILALDMKTGRIAWTFQAFQGDAFISGCGKTNAEGTNCPQTLGPDWDFGGASAILKTLPDGRDVLVAAGKGGVAWGLDPDRKGAVMWKTQLWDDTAPGAGGLVVFGGAADAATAYYPLNRPRGGMAAVDLATGRRVWTASTMTTEERRGQSAAASAIPGVVFTGAWDGTLRAVATGDGKVVWSFDTRRAFDTVNGVAARGGSLGSPGPTIAGGMVFVGSGYTGTQNGTPGNVILAFAPDQPALSR